MKYMHTFFCKLCVFLTMPVTARFCQNYIQHMVSYGYLTFVEFILLLSPSDKMPNIDMPKITHYTYTDAKLYLNR